ncbi:unnamed protein product [Cunninghamella echinulata]
MNINNEEKYYHSTIVSPIMYPSYPTNRKFTEQNSHPTINTPKTVQHQQQQLPKLSNNNYLYPNNDYHYSPSRSSTHPSSPSHNYVTNGVRTRHIPLYQGNLVLECPVPTSLLDQCPLRDKTEFNQMRYTAVTCQPDDFSLNDYTLRPKLMNRETELFIGVTMYNENEILFTRTMHAVMKNIAYLCSRKKSKVWGEMEGWKKVVVGIVQDGRKSCNPRVLDVLSTMGVYQKGIAKNMVNGKPVQAHLFEYTTQLSVDADLKLKGVDKGIVPVQILFCLKEQNTKKINSHCWLFNAFGPILQPNICVLIDVGTRPDVGGVCGEICVMKGKAFLNLLNPLVAAQNFEYKMSNILDKPMESVFGYISVLPGAFSAYRYVALLNDVNGQGPLQKYFINETPTTLLDNNNNSNSNTKQSFDSDIFTKNMYLAEDRILCFELIAKKHQKWILKYVKSAFGETDCPNQLPEFISQRRRWLNGSFFAAVYSIWHFKRIWKTDHTTVRKIMLSIEFIFNFLNLMLNWFCMANFYLTFYFISKSLAIESNDPFGNGWGERIFHTLCYLYIFLFIVSFICSMGNRPQGSKCMFTISVIAYSIIMLYTVFAGAWLSFQGISSTIEKSEWHQGGSTNHFLLLMQQPTFRNIFLSLASTYGLYLVSGLFFMDFSHMFTSFIQYILLLPTYVNILNIYAFCNIHDVSWGTKGDNALQMDLGVANKVSSGKGMDTVEVELVDGLDMINKNYQIARSNLETKQNIIKQSRSPHTKQDDYYRGFRTKLVLAWIGCNALLITFITSDSFQLSPNSQPKQQSIEYREDMSLAYTGFLLWIITGVSCFRFIGSLVYIILHWFKI